jgi:hypothetical protein
VGRQRCPDLLDPYLKPLHSLQAFTGGEIGVLERCARVVIQ